MPEGPLGPSVDQARPRPVKILDSSSAARTEGTLLGAFLQLPSHRLSLARYTFCHRQLAILRNMIDVAVTLLDRPSLPPNSFEQDHTLQSR